MQRPTLLWWWCTVVVSVCDFAHLGMHDNDGWYPLMLTCLYPASQWSFIPISVTQNPSPQPPPGVDIPINITLRRNLNDLSDVQLVVKVNFGQEQTLSTTQIQAAGAQPVACSHQHGQRPGRSQHAQYDTWTHRMHVELGITGYSDNLFLIVLPGDMYKFRGVIRHTLFKAGDMVRWYAQVS